MTQLLPLVKKSYTQFYKENSEKSIGFCSIEYIPQVPVTPTATT